MKRIIVWIALFGSLILLTSCKSEEVKLVEEQIESIGTITENSEGLILEVRIAYDALTDGDQAKVINYDILESAEIEYNTTITKNVEEIINAIGMINDESLMTIERARSEFEDLTEEQKGSVTNFGKLVEAEQEYEEYIVDRSIDTLLALSDISLDDVSLIDEAEEIYGKLTPEQKRLVAEEIGDVDNLIKKAKIQGVETAISRITYSKDEPSIDDLNSIITALEAYYQLNSEEQEMIESYKKVETAIKGYLTYKKNREKSDKLYIRNQYIEECEVISIEDLTLYPKSYEGKHVSMDIQINGIEKGGLFTGDKIVALTDTQVPVELRDKRKIKEPLLSEGERFTVYGTYEGVVTIKVTEEGSGLFGSDMFEKVSDKYEVPVIEFIYVSNDNLGVIAAGDPTDTESRLDEEAENLKENLDQWIMDIDNLE